MKDKLSYYGLAWDLTTASPQLVNNKNYTMYGRIMTAMGIPLLFRPITFTFDKDGYYKTGHDKLGPLYITKGFAMKALEEQAIAEYKAKKLWAPIIKQEEQDNTPLVTWLKEQLKK